jgi:uncharacterized protein YecT (DUF1311 family)
MAAPEGYRVWLRDIAVERLRENSLIELDVPIYPSHNSQPEHPPELSQALVLDLVMRAFAIASTFLLLLSGSAGAQQPFEGKWGVSQEECQDDEGPNANTVISGTTFDRYELHCRIGKISQSNRTWTLDMSCEAEGEKLRSTARLSVIGDDKLELEQAEYGNGRRETLLRCAPVKPQEASTDPASGTTSLLSKSYSDCMDKSEGVTVNMLDCSADELRRHDTLFNESYRKLMASAAPPQREELKEAQRAWIKYRDTSCSLMRTVEGGGTLG